MEHCVLGKTNLTVSRLALGAAPLGNPGLPETQVEGVLKGALDLGINFIDTAAMYDMSEERIGRHLARRKDDFFIATKCGVLTSHASGTRELINDYTPAGIRRTVDQSRKKLNLDVIDVLQFHGLPPAAGLEKAFETLLDLKHIGWTRFVGVSADGPAAAAFAGKPTIGQNAADIATQWPVDTWQFTYNFLSQEAAHELIPALRENNIGTIIKRPISNVVWALPDEPEDDFFRKPWQRAQEIPLHELSADLPLVEFALRFTLSHPHVDTILVGTTNAAHLAHNIASADKGPLPQHLLQKTRSIFERPFGHG